MLALGTLAPEFTLPDTNGKTIAFKPGTKATLVLFICNHCPYVKHIAPELARIGHDYRTKEIAIYAISSNDAANYPEDAPEKMAQEAAQRGYPFPYLYDETQEIAKRYRAACTPDFFLFDAESKLAYRGQLDSSRPGNDIPVTGADLRAAIENLLAGKPVAADQLPSIGCNIKWKPGNEPGFF